MAALSDFAETKILEFMLDANPNTWTSPATVYVSLHTADVQDDGSGTEVSGNAYARVGVTGGFGVTGDTADNDAAITFPTASGGAWGTVTHVGIWDASSGGNLLVHGVLSASKVVGDGDTFEFAIGNLDVVLA